MLVKQDLINKIKDYFDLNVYETKVWLALLGKGTASAGEIAEISAVPRSRTSDVLESLEKKGFAIVKLGKQVKYLGVKHKMILDKLRNNVKKEAEDRIESLSNIKETDEFLQLEELYNGGIDPIKREEISAALKGRSTISSYLREINWSILGKEMVDVRVRMSFTVYSMMSGNWLRMYSFHDSRGYMTVLICMKGIK